MGFFSGITRAISKPFESATKGLLKTVASPLLTLLGGGQPQASGVGSFGGAIQAAPDATATPQLTPDLIRQMFQAAGGLPEKVAESMAGRGLGGGSYGAGLGTMFQNLQSNVRNMLTSANIPMAQMPNIVPTSLDLRDLLNRGATPGMETHPTLPGLAKLVFKPSTTSTSAGGWLTPLTGTNDLRTLFSMIRPLSHRIEPTTGSFNGIFGKIAL